MLLTESGWWLARLAGFLGIHVVLLGGLLFALA
jgi:hypothetical protein